MSATLTKKELAFRWGVSVRTVERDVKRFGLEPEKFIGIQPVWTETAVQRMERRRLAARRKWRKERAA